MVTPRPDFWSGRRVLVTGHTGFKGSWLCLWLRSLGAEVAGFADGRPTDPALFDIAGLSDGVRWVEGDVRDAAALARVVERERPEVVLHLAAQSLVQASYADPAATYAVNVIGSVNLLEAVRRSPTARVVINVTSDKCYENRDWVWGYREDDALGGRDPYSSSKACSEIVTAAYRSSFFGSDDAPRLASVRAGNVIGGGDFAPDRLVPDLVRGVLAREPTLVRNPAAVRPWQHVLNPLNGYLILAERLWEDPGFAESFNFGPDDADVWSVRQVAQRLVELWGQELRWQTDERWHAPEARSLHVDSAKARARLGWDCVWGLERALETTVEWYRAYERRADLRALMLDQIGLFTHEAAEPGRERVPEGRETARGAPQPPA